MSELLKTMRGALTLNIPALVRFRDRQNVFRDGILVLVLVALVMGVVPFVVDFIGGFFTSPQAELAQVRQVFDQIEQFLPPGAVEPFRDQFLGNFEAGMEIGVEVEALPTRLPKVIGRLFESLAGWVHQPLAMLGGFLAYGIWVMLAARLLGGTGRLQEFLGTAALSALPYLLLILEKIPCLGTLLGVVAWIWSLLIWIAATAVAHGWAVPQGQAPQPAPEPGQEVPSAGQAPAEGEIERYQVRWGRATLAVILPALALIVLGLLGVISLAVVIAAVSD